VVHPRNYGTDNGVTLDALAQLGPIARGIAVVTPEVTDAELKRFHDAGIRGVRFSLTHDPKTWVVRPDMIEPMAKRIADLHLHLQLAMDGEMIEQMASMLRRLPGTVVFDHLARPPQPAGIDHVSHRIVRELLDKGDTWVKLSCAYINTRIGPPYPDATRIAQAFVNAAPERVVWGSDWPHPSVVEKPDDALLFDLLAAWAPDETTRNRILVENPEVLYGFGA
jgi:predicted TIM-barrel fold metal-dependent hydrolase